MLRELCKKLGMFDYRFVVVRIAVRLALASAPTLLPGLEVLVDRVRSNRRDL